MEHFEISRANLHRRIRSTCTHGVRGVNYLNIPYLKFHFEFRLSRYNTRSIMATVRENTWSTCHCEICNNVRERIRRIFCVIQKYRWLLDAYIVDFYKDDLWDKLPGSWINFFENITPMELGSWILNESPRRNNRTWPLSLQALRKVIEILQINRDPGCEISLRCKNSDKREAVGGQSSKPSETLNKKEIRNDDTIILKKKNSSFDEFSNHPKLRNLFNKSVKPKKRHEIVEIARIVADCANSAKTKYAADVGAGIGHLARTLAYKYEMCVTCVEQQSPLSEQARKIDSQFELLASKYVPNFKGQKPVHVPFKIENDVSGCSVFVERLNHEFKNKFVKLNSELSGFGLIGLHPCGDLATTLLQCYAESNCAKFICIAGCCYMKMTLGDEGESMRSYPLSKYLSFSKSNELSYAALEVACHAIENHCKKLKSADYWDLKIHAYRATLECLILKRNPSLRHGPLKSVKLKEHTTFKEYCLAATENIADENRPGSSPQEFEDPRIIECLENWERVVIFGSLRFMLAPLVESVVLLDRFLYLSERNLSPRLKAVFDPLISPRNFVITSVK